MIKSHLEQITKQEEVVDGIYCDCCGKPIDVGNHEYLHIDKDWGQFSKHDNNNDEFDICEDCYYKIADTFKINLHTTNLQDNFIDYGEALSKELNL